MSRDFSRESIANYVFRLIRAISVRLRGFSYSILGTFSHGSSTSIAFGPGARFINSRAILLHNGVSFGTGVRLECFRLGTKSPCGTIEIGSNSSFGDNCHIGSAVRVEVAEDVLAGSNILISDHTHGSPVADLREETPIAPRLRQLKSKGPIRIERGVWIGDGVKILPGVTVGEFSVISTNSIVRKNVEPRTVFFSAS